jgi:type II secretory pathway predicted ATPase ExeA
MTSLRDEECEANFTAVPIKSIAKLALQCRERVVCAPIRLSRYTSQIMPTSTIPSGLTLRQLAGREERVFPSYPLVARYFPSAAMEDARKRLGRAIERGDGPGLVVGAPGVGKSLQLQVLASQYHARFDVVLLACARLCTRRALLQAILFELGLPYKMRDEGELRLSLLDHLLSTNESPAGLLLLVDEAHTLPIALLDELRVMTNLVRNGAPRVRLVLAGSAALEELFAHPDLESFSQRLAARCYLAPLGREETVQFIRAQLAASQGAPDENFAPDAWEIVFEATDGVPRLINQLCDRALMFGGAENVSRIDRHILQRAWSDLQQLPTPWETPPETPSGDAGPQVIEFGGLSDNVFSDPRREPDECAVIEPTELDVDAVVADRQEEIVESCQAERTAAADAADPFGEEFEEEEVVLDNFAAWDEMFRRQMPRVENQREPNFATLVGAAMGTAAHESDDRDEAPFAEANDCREATIVLEDSSGDGDEVAEFDLHDREDSAGEPEFAADWPPLRLAVVADPAPLQPIPLMPPTKRVSAIGAAAMHTMTTTLELNQGANRPAALETPVLVVEDDRTPRRANPQVRREEYRNLFSRLRSG